MFEKRFWYQESVNYESDSIESFLQELTTNISKSPERNQDSDFSVLLEVDK